MAQDTLNLHSTLADSNCRCAGDHLHSRSQKFDSLITMLPAVVSKLEVTALRSDSGIGRLHWPLSLSHDTHSIPLKMARTAEISARSLEAAETHFYLRRTLPRMLSLLRLGSTPQIFAIEVKFLCRLGQFHNEWLGCVAHSFCRPDRLSR